MYIYIYVYICTFVYVHEHHPACDNGQFRENNYSYTYLIIHNGNYQYTEKSFIAHSSHKSFTLFQSSIDGNDSYTNKTILMYIHIQISQFLCIVHIYTIHLCVHTYSKYETSS